MSVLALSVFLVPLLGAEPPSSELPRLVLQEAVTEPTPPPESSGFNFELLPEHRQTAEERAHADSIASSIATRRKMLQLHQGFGIATAALLVATVVVGQLSYSDKFGGPNSGQYEMAHDWLEAAATLSFATTGLLALFAPVPIAKESHGFDSIALHKWSMLAATAGFAAEIVLGIITVSEEGHLDQRNLAIAHLVTGYATTAAFATGVAALAFP